MADRDPIWSFGESQLLYSPTSGLDAAWSFGESFLLDEYQISGVTAGTTSWGHSTGVTETNVRTFTGNWTGTGSIENSSDAERLIITEGQNMVSEVIDTNGAQTITVTTNKYDTGDTPTIEYRTGATQVACEAASWTTYSAPFSSTGFIQIRLSY